MKEVKFDRENSVITSAAASDKSLYTTCYGRVDRFEIVDELPVGYDVWNIGRHNFPFPGYVPLAVIDPENYHVDMTSPLKAIRCKSEEIALRIMDIAVRKGISRNMFNELMQG